ncbi:MAG: hypothetical protein RIB60_07580 [Phycisphaerales bacterium]
MDIYKYRAAVGTDGIRPWTIEDEMKVGHDLVRTRCRDPRRWEQHAEAMRDFGRSDLAATASSAASLCRLRRILIRIQWAAVAVVLVSAGILVAVKWGAS